MIGPTNISPTQITQLKPAALALAFGIAGAVVALLFGAVMGGMWGMGGGTGGGWMHGSVAGGSGYGGSMMGGGLGFLGYALVCGFLGGALAGGVSASVYNYLTGRTASFLRSEDVR